jgi:hypothetical protein
VIRPGQLKSEQEGNLRGLRIALSSSASNVKINGMVAEGEMG